MPYIWPMCGSTHGNDSGGLNNGQYRLSTSQTPSNTTGQPSTTYLGTTTTIPAGSYTISASATTGTAGTTTRVTNVTVTPINPYPEYDPTPVIKTGEITAYRVWRIDHDWDGIGNVLRSVYMNGVVWKPGEVKEAHKVSEWHGDGIHAFKTMEDLMREYEPNRYCVYGEVLLWGEVIEHEFGYKAQFAKVKKLTYLKGGLLSKFRLWRLRKLYGV